MRERRGERERESHDWSVEQMEKKGLKEGE